MTETLWVALFSLAGTLGGSLLGIIAANKLVMYRLEQLEKRVEAHNNLIDRTYKLEKHEGELDIELENLADAVHRLEKYHA
jgi:hypothetical protein